MTLRNQAIFTANALCQLAARGGTPSYAPLTLADVASILREHAADLRKAALAEDEVQP